MSTSTFRSNLIKSAFALAFAAGIVVPQVGCATTTADDGAAEAVSAFESANAYTSTTDSSGNVTLRSPDGSTLFSGHIDASQFEQVTDASGHVAFRFDDGSTVTVLSSEKTSSGFRYQLQLADGSRLTVDNRETRTGDDPAPGAPGDLQPRFVPIIIGGVIAIGVISGAISWHFTSANCDKAFAAAQKVCTDAGLIPSGGGCEVLYLVRYKMTPPECILKPVAGPVKAVEVSK